MELGRSNDVSAWRSQRVFQRSVYTYLKLLLSSLPVAVPVNGAHTVLFSSVPRCGLSSFFFFFNFIYLFLAALGFYYCAWAFSSCGEQGLLFVVVRGLLIAVASLCCRARALGTWASVVVARGL